MIQVKTNDNRSWGINAIKEINIAEVEDFHIGHAQNYDAATGCTVIICDKMTDAVTGVDVRGGLPGSRNTDTIDPRNDPKACHAILLSGGSWFGLNAAGGVENYLEEKGIGYHIRNILLPNVAEAIIFDLAIGDSKVRPDEEMAYQACENAYSNNKWEDGTIGAGTGATVGKILGMQSAMKGGLGSYCLKKDNLYVGAIMVVNAVGDVWDPSTFQIIGGARNESDNSFINTEKYILENFDHDVNEGGNTTIGVIITNAKISKAQASKLATMGQDGLARTIRPVHTMSDGDTIFTMATGEVEASMNLIEVMAIRSVEEAIASAVRSAKSIGGIISYSDISGHS